MPDLLNRLSSVLVEVVLPNLTKIQVNQAEQRNLTDTLNQSLEDFRSEMQLCFEQMRAELASNRAELDEALATLREVQDQQSSAVKQKSRLVH